MVMVNRTNAKQSDIILHSCFNHISFPFLWAQRIPQLHLDFL